MSQKERYDTPEILISRIESDIITFSEEEEWTGPMIDVGIDPMMEE